MRLRGIGSVLLLAGCVRAPAQPAPTAAVTPEPPVATETKTPSTPAVEAPAKTAKPVAAAPEQSATVVASRLPPGAVIEWPDDGGVVSSHASVLFDDEMSALRDTIGKTLVKRGIAVVPMVELEAVESAAASGVLLLEDNRRCAVGLTREDVRARYLADRPRVYVDATCFEECRLTVRIETPGAEDAYFASKAIAKPELPAQWIAAAARLSDDVYGYGGLGLSGASHNPDVFFETPAWIGPWSRVVPTSDRFDALEPSVQGCGSADALLDLRYIVRVAVAPSGAVERCAAEEASDTPATRERQCLCDAVSTMRFGRGKAHRRLRIDAVDTGFGGSGVPETTALQPGTDPWVNRLLASTMFERCSSTDPLPKNLDAVLSMRVDPAGVVDDVRIDGGVNTAAAMRWAQCVVGEAATVSLPCAPPGIDRLRIRLRSGP